MARGHRSTATDHKEPDKCDKGRQEPHKDYKRSGSMAKDTEAHQEPK